MATYQCQVKRQKTSSSTNNLQHFQSPPPPHYVLLISRFFNLMNDMQGSIEGLWRLYFPSFFKFLVENETAFEFTPEKRAVAEKKDDGKVTGEDAKLVMTKLGLFCSQRGGGIEESITADDLLELFNDSEPSLEELKDAFDVFDRNRDGFIDATELQRVLNALGLKEDAELQSCAKMIRNFDQNKDGRIDFKEFVRLMEITLS